MKIYRLGFIIFFVFTAFSLTELNELLNVEDESEVYSELMSEDYSQEAGN